MSFEDHILNCAQWYHSQVPSTNDKLPAKYDDEDALFSNMLNSLMFEAHHAMQQKIDMPDKPILNAVDLETSEPGIIASANGGQIDVSRTNAPPRPVQYKRIKNKTWEDNSKALEIEVSKIDKLLKQAKGKAEKKALKDEESAAAFFMTKEEKAADRERKKKEREEKKKEREEKKKEREAKKKDKEQKELPEQDAQEELEQAMAEDETNEGEEHGEDVDNAKAPTPPSKKDAARKQVNMSEQYECVSKSDDVLKVKNLGKARIIWSFTKVRYCSTDT